MIPWVIMIIPFALVIAGLAYIKWLLTPPNEVIGSSLEDTPARTINLIHVAQHQHYRETWHRGCDD